MDFDSLIALEGSPYQYAIVIYRECDGVYSEYWKGYFSYFDYKVDLDKCVLEFEPTVWDEYSVVFDQWNVEYNVLGAGTQEIVRMDAYEYEFEEAGYDYLSLYLPPFASWTQHPTYTADVANQFYLYSQTWEDIPNSDLFMVHEVYRRDWQIVASGAVPGGSWVQAEILSDGREKYVRPWLDAGVLGWTNYQSSTAGDDKIFTQIVGSPDNVPFYGCILLNDIMDFFASNLNLTYTSNFFQDTPGPMTKFTLSQTMVQQISNVRGGWEWATKGMMTLKDLMTWIRDTFNVFWYIDANGDFRVEHRRYFEYGLSYTYIHVLELNLISSYPTDIKNMNRYEWETPEMYRRERWEFPYSLLPDWAEAGIDYPYNSILNNDVMTRNPQWATDLVSIYDRRDELSNEGWVLLDTYLKDIGGGISIRYVRMYPGAISNNDIQNGWFSTGQLLKSFWTYGRTLRDGEVNGTLTTFETVKRLKKQVELSIPECCLDLDYNGLYRTELGDGWISEAEYIAKSGTLKLNLIYE